MGYKKIKIIKEEIGKLFKHNDKDLLFSKEIIDYSWVCMWCEKFIGCKEPIWIEEKARNIKGLENFLDKVENGIIKIEE